MKKSQATAVFFALAFATTAFAETPRVKVAPVQKPPWSVEVRTTGFGVLRQDLFDRNNPRNLRFDWPAPPAQPGQF